MAKSKARERRRAAAAGRSKLRARKSSVPKGPKLASGKPKPARLTARKRPPAREPETAKLKRLLQTAKLQQQASAEILRAVANAAGDVAGPLQLIAETTARLFGATSVSIQLAEGREFTQEYRVGAIAKRIGSAYPRSNIKVGGRNLPGTVVADNRQIHIPDLDHLDPSMADFPGLPHARAGGARTVCGTPLRCEGSAIGALIVFRDQLLPFTDDELALQQSFADQAVIAIENARLFNETREALERQTATSGILRIINQSPSDVTPVFDAIAERARVLCGALLGATTRFDGELLHLVGYHGVSPQAEAVMRSSFPRKPDLSSINGRCILAKSPVQIADIEKDPHYQLTTAAKAADYRSLVAVPMLQGGDVIGVIAVTRKEPGEFPRKLIDLLQTFADQAVIAIENVRLFEEVQAKTRDLEGSLQQQTATADVLKVISRSAFDLDAVMNTLARSAAELCAASLCGLHIREGDFLVCRGYSGATKEQEEFVRQARIPAGDMNYLMSRVLSSREVANIGDFETLGSLPIRTFQEKLGFKSLLMVPLTREGLGIGLFVLGRPHAGEFSSRHIELVQTFADQAVIAIENARLFDEVQAKTRDLTEALTYQTGSANILNVIASSPTDVAPVLKAIVESACELCEANDAIVYLRDGEDLLFSAQHGPLEFTVEKWPIDRATAAGRAFVDRMSVHIHDVLSEEGDQFPAGQRAARRIGVRTMLSAPLLREGESIGTIVLRRSHVHPFSEKQIALLQTFADQAVIAIGNVRLFEEVQAKTRDLTEALQQQTATADVLKVISRSAFDLQTVLETLARSAVELSGALNGIIFLRDGDVFRYRASSHGDSNPAWVKWLEDHPQTPGRNTATARAIATGKVACVEDVAADPEVDLPATPLAGIRAALSVPLIRDGKVEGVMTLTRQVPGPFTDRQIELVQTFADQAVIAIENVRLFEQVQARTRELAKSLEDLRTAQDRLVQTEKLASLGQLTAGIAHEIKNPLNFVNNFSALSVELTDELNDLLRGSKISEDIAKEVDELTSLLKDNLGKVVQHGRRADSIVKNMLLHSRDGSGEHRPSDINALVEESLNLAYHGARAEKSQFNVRIERDLDPEAGKIEAFPQEITRVLLNLISNGFYAVSKRKAENGNSGFAPVVKAATRGLPAHVEIRIRDNGTGIPPEVKEKMFNPFFTTKPAGEGTGLGLSMSHDIVVKQHGGTIDVETVPGEFTEFTIRLPRTVDFKVSNRGDA